MSRLPQRWRTQRLQNLVNHQDFERTLRFREIPGSMLIWVSANPSQRFPLVKACWCVTFECCRPRSCSRKTARLECRRSFERLSFGQGWNFWDSWDPNEWVSADLSIIAKKGGSDSGRQWVSIILILISNFDFVLFPLVVLFRVSFGVVWGWLKRRQDRTAQMKMWEWRGALYVVWRRWPVFLVCLVSFFLPDLRLSKITRWI